MKLTKFAFTLVFAAVATSASAQYEYRQPERGLPRFAVLSGFAALGIAREPERHPARRDA